MARLAHLQKFKLLTKTILLLRFLAYFTKTITES
nr:MAG TPA: hypothetical protein [Caudoviricetes sp.]